MKLINWFSAVFAAFICFRSVLHLVFRESVILSSFRKTAHAPGFLLSKSGLERPAGSKDMKILVKSKKMMQG